MDELIKKLEKLDTAIKYLINEREVNKEEFVNYIIEKIKSENVKK